MESRDKKVWFPAKKYGYGWGAPRCWQGWAVLIAYVTLLIGGAQLLNPASRPVLSYGYLACLTVLFGVVAWAKGEKAAWRWRKKEQDI